MALPVISGLGAGLMQGSQFVAGQRQQRENNKYRDAMMGMQTERHGWQKQQVEQQQADQERINTLNTLKTRIEDQYKDRPDFEREQMYFENALSTGLIKPEELKTAREAYEGMIQNFGLEAVDEFYLTGKVDGLNKIIGQRTPGARIEAGERGSLRVIDPSGSANELDAMGIKQLLSLNKALERQSSRDQAGLAAEKDRSAIRANNALAHSRLNPTTRSGAGGGGGSRATGADGKPFDAIGSQKDYGAAFGDEDVFDRARGHTYFRQLQDNNPELFKTESGQAMALTASRAMAEGSAEVFPVIAEDGSLQLRAKVGANDYVLESGVPDDRMIELMKQYTPADPEKPGFFKRIIGATPQPPAGVDEQFIGQMYVNALREQAVKNPSEFEAAWLLANEPEALQQAMQEVRDGEADVGQQRMVQAALTLQRGLNHLQEQPSEASDARRPTGGARDEFSREFNRDEPQDDPLANALALEAPPSLGDAIVDTGTRVVGGLAEGIGSVARTAVGANPAQRERNVNAEIEQYKRAKASGNRSLINYHAQNLYRLASGDEALTEHVMRAIGEEPPQPIRQANQ